MYLGKIMEIAKTEDLFIAPHHPYTTALLGSLLSMDPDKRTEAAPISGDPPNPIDPPAGCRFHTRCPYAAEVCTRNAPALSVEDTHAVACHRHNTASGYTLATPIGSV